MMFYEGDYEDINSQMKPLLFHLSIREAAELVAADMWSEGKFPEIKEPDDWSGSGRDPILLALLTDQIKQFESRITAAVDSGLLNALNTIRNFDEALIENQPRIHIKDLVAWLHAHAYSDGAVVLEWRQRELNIEEMLNEEFVYLRALSRDGEDAFADLPLISDGPVRLHEVDSMEHANVMAAYKALVIRHDRLAHLANSDKEESTKKANARVDRPLSTRERRTLLTIIAALCTESGINHQERGAPNRIALMTEQIGATVSDDAVGRILKGIPDAMETRMK